ncbi:hypothetical protein E1298_45055 [Actinomadura rubrisoli]|uniref:Uncharacterized protein n=1 Tax=Actinomadura rubrisoli TaxID=2530368 RepID=A0A4R4ZS62_9ACTN|nr:hypothetical protein E1298_45055 [Actinomadura rubrisoli]
MRAEAQAPEPPAPARPVPRTSPYAPDPLEFEEAEPVLAPRRSARGRTRAADPLPDLAEEPEPTPAPVPVPANEGTVVLEGHIAEEPEPEPEPVPTSRDDPERTENRGGAIYVLREEPKGD